MKVDQQVNLLQWLSFPDWITLSKVSISLNWVTTDISDPSNYVPEYPWTCSIIFTIVKNGTNYTVSVDNLTIKPLDYTAPSLSTVDVINTSFSWYNLLPQQKKDFIYNHLLTSYIANERYKQNNMEYIIMGEVPKDIDCENVWRNNSSDIKTHANHGYWHIQDMSPNWTIKACWWTRTYLKDYIDANPDKIFMVSCAADRLWWDTIEQLRSDENYQILKDILTKENVIVSAGWFNISSDLRKTLNENEEPQEWWGYRSASVNSKKNNKITVVWYDPTKNNIFWEDEDAARPIWFWEWNIVVPFMPLVSNWDYVWDDTACSYATAAQSWSLWNFLSILMKNHSWSTLEDAMTIMINNYLTEDTFKYKNDNGNIVNWEKWYFFNTDKFIKNEILSQASINSIQFNSNDVQLPSDNWLCYVWKWIQFEYNGQRYDVCNQAMLNQAITSWNNIQRYWNKDSFLKYWGTTNVNFKVYVLDKNGKIIPDVSLDVNKNI